MRNERQLRAALLASVLACSLGALPAHADTRSEAGWGIGSALASLVYVPVKVAYATAGAVFGGVAWGLSGGNADIIGAVVTPAVRGDYLVTPAHLRRERRLEFVGRDPGFVESEPAAFGLEEAEASYGEVPYEPFDDAYDAN
jgi:hypothetical protein